MPDGKPALDRSLCRPGRGESLVNMGELRTTTKPEQEAKRSYTDLTGLRQEHRSSERCLAQCSWIDSLPNQQ